MAWATTRVAPTSGLDEAETARAWATTRVAPTFGLDEAETARAWATTRVAPTSGLDEAETASAWATTRVAPTSGLDEAETASAWATTRVAPTSGLDEAETARAWGNRVLWATGVWPLDLPFPARRTVSQFAAGTARDYRALSGIIRVKWPYLPRKGPAGAGRALPLDTIRRQRMTDMNEWRN